MALDSTRDARRAILELLKTDSGVTELVPASEIYSQRAPAAHGRDFIVYGPPIGTPIVAACVDGSRYDVSISGFAKPRMQGQTTVETAEDHASRIGEQIVAALGGARGTLARGKFSILWLGGRLIRDGDEADAFQTVQNFRIRCLTA